MLNSARIWLALALLLSASALAETPEPIVTQRDSPDRDAIAVLAGTPSQLSQPPAGAAKHASNLTSGWAQMKRARLDAMAAWAGAELSDAGANCKTLLYPFSGPDVVSAITLFPKCRNFQLIADQKVGTAPTLADLQSQAGQVLLARTGASFRHIFGLGYFRTLTMRADDLEILPMLLIFLERMRLRVESIESLSVPGPNGIEGTRITFLNSWGAEQTVTYWDVNLSNAGGAKLTTLLNELHRGAEGGRTVSFLKAASYLLHEDHFSRTRNFLLAESDALLQDDSGIPLRAFPATGWDFTFFGTYGKPIDLFKLPEEPAMRRAYDRAQETSTLRTLPFEYGYGHDSHHSSAILATRRERR